MGTTLHIFPHQKFTDPYIQFINNNFNENEHIFLIHGQTELTYEYSNVFLYTKKEFLALVPQVTQVIVHSFFIPNYMLVDFCKSHKYLYKFNWVIWGGDLAYLYSSTNKKEVNLKTTVRIYLVKQLLKKFGYITSLVKNDYDEAIKLLNSQAVYRAGIYVNPIKKEYLNELKIQNQVKDEFIIQIGNSADSSNNHKQVIDMLEKYKDENIKVYAPLSYGGNPCYVIEVNEYGKSILGEKFIGLLDFMTPHEYTRFLTTVDVAIFNQNRQQALGNIFSLAYLEAKIYLRKDTTMWQELIEEGYKLEDVKEIFNQSFEEFKSLKKEIGEINKNLSQKRFDESYMKEVWEDIFN